MTRSPIAQPDVARRLEALIRELPPPPDVVHFTVRSHGCNALLPARKSRKPRKPSIRKLVEQAERTGKIVTSITTPDGTKFDFGRATPAEPVSSNPVTVTDFDEWVNKKRKSNAD